MLTDDLENAESVVGSSILQSIAELYPEFDQEVFLETAVSVDDFSSGHQEIIQTGMNISTDELKRAT